jgi:acyl-CoA dehydrogenase
MIDFRIEPEFQEVLDWITAFVKEKCEALDLLFPGQAVAR